ncbi:hypothetical protein R0I52_00145 [Psychrobacter sp. CAM01]|uniref:hypothetical protein n=1 Tax=Psychrobacter TaxID=497 RepID=UPI00293636B9|nr:hypothetical protein [Psychrobacter sp. CAM01]MDV2859121.1 hypothetical protein [Psychrobacter sp. CAM01]
MDVNQIQHVVSFDDVIREHMTWLLATLPIIYAAIAGAGIRLLLVRAEPFWMRTQNAAAGVLLAITLAETTAMLFTNGNYGSGYAVVYGMVGRELFVTMYEFIHDRAAPVLLSAMRHYFPFLFTKDNEDNHDNT